MKIKAAISFRICKMGIHFNLDAKYETKREKMDRDNMDDVVDDDDDITYY